MFNIDQLPQDDLRAYAILLSLAMLVLVVTFIFRELGRRELDGVVQVASPVESMKEGIYADSEGELVEMKVLEVIQLSPMIKLFRLKPLNEYVNYKPGQFLAFHTGLNRGVVRCYSLCSTPSRAGIYEVAVRLLEGGKGSTWMHEQVKLGDKLKVNNPAGRFVFEQKAKSSVFVAGGIGVTPMLSMLKYAIDTGDQRELYFFYSSRTLEELVFHDELLMISSRSSRVHYIPMLTRASESWLGLVGRINEEMMLATGLNFSEAELYTCGPSAMMDSVKELAVRNGLPSESFYKEIFSSPESTKQEERHCKITFEGETFDYKDNVPLLDFLEKQGKQIPYSCRTGVCGSCECTITQGSVTMLESDYLNEDDLEAGRRLSCISYPKEDLSVEF